MSVSSSVSSLHYALRVRSGEEKDAGGESSRRQRALASPASSPDASGATGAVGLAALLGRITATSGSSTGGTGTTTPATDPAATLGQALSTLLRALPSTSVDSPDGSPGASADAIHSAIDTLRSAFAPTQGSDATTVTSAPTVAANDDVTTEETPAPRPNLDALNRVLTHYAAQSAAASVPFSIVEG